MFVGPKTWNMYVGSKTWNMFAVVCGSADVHDSLHGGGTTTCGAELGGRASEHVPGLQTEQLTDVRKIMIIIDK